MGNSSDCHTEPSGIGANEVLAKYGLYLYVISLIRVHEARNTTGDNQAWHLTQSGNPNIR